MLSSLLELMVLCGIPDSSGQRLWKLLHSEAFWWGFFLFFEIWKRIYRTFLYCLLLSLTCRYMLTVRPRAGAQTWGEQLRYLWCALTGHLVQRELKQSTSRKKVENGKKKNPFDEIWMIFSSESSFHRFLEKWHPTSQLCAKVCRFHYLDFSLWFLTLTHQGLSRKSLSGNQTWWSGDQCKAFAPKLHKNATLN